MFSRREVLLGFAALALAGAAHGQELPSASDDELTKFKKYCDFVRARFSRDYAIATPNGIEEAKYLKVGGIEQWVTIRGEDRANPVVLVLHGGPGDVTNPWGYAGFRTWLKSYTVVQWDQRGAGRTLGRNGPGSAANLNVDRWVKDGVELAEQLRASLGKDKIILIGQSAGSVLGVLMAKSRPELFQAFVGTGQVSDPSKALKVGYDALLAKAHALGDARAIRELEEVGPPPWKKGPGYQVQHRWANLFERADFFISSTTGFGLNAPGYTFPRDIDDWLDGEVLSGERLQDELIAMPASELRGKFAIPMYAIQGDEDFTTPTALAKSWVDDIEAPRKAFVTIQGGHFAAFTNPSQFLQALGRVLQPAAHH